MSLWKSFPKKELEESFELESSRDNLRVDIYTVEGRHEPVNFVLTKDCSF